MTIEPQEKIPWFGFFSITALIGLCLGFLPFDIHAGADGHTWNRHGYETMTLVGMIGGALAGLMFGWLLHTNILDGQMRRRTLRWLWGLFFCCSCIYLFLRPAIYAAR